MINARKDVPVLIQCKVEGDSGSLYVRAAILTSAYALVDLLELNYLGDGIYSYSYTYTGNERNLIINFNGYTDAGHTTPDTSRFYKTEDMLLDDSSLETDVKRLLGLVHENVYIDTTTYDVDDNLISGRLRIYSEASSVGTASDVIGTYTITVTADGAGKFTNWKMVKV